MRGFADKALVLFPRKEDFEAKPVGWRSKFSAAYNNLYLYFKSRDIDVHVFYTDDVGRMYVSTKDNYIGTLSKADLFFVSKHCVGMEAAMSIPKIEFPDIYAEIARKDMVAPNASEMERFNMVLRHANDAAKQIMQDYSIIVNFMKKSSPQYKVKPKLDDGRILVNVDIDNFVPECFMSGTSVDTIDVFDLKCANRAMHSWEVN